MSGLKRLVLPFVEKGVQKGIEGMIADPATIFFTCSVNDVQVRTVVIQFRHTERGALIPAREIQKIDVYVRDVFTRIFFKYYLGTYLAWPMIKSRMDRTGCDEQAAKDALLLQSNMVRLQSNLPKVIERDLPSFEYWSDIM